MLRLTLLCLLAACSSSPTLPGQDGWRRDLDAARARWQAAGHTDYAFTYSRSCFCPQQVLRVTVRDGAVIAISDMVADTLFVAPFDDFTIPGLFGTIRASIDGRPASFTAEYDAATGRPVSVATDPIANAADDEHGFIVSEFSLGDDLP